MTNRSSFASLNSKQKLLENLFNYYKGIYFKDRFSFDKAENSETESNWLKFEILYEQLANPVLSYDENILANSNLASYVEQNDYLIALRNTLIALGVNKSSVELRKTGFYQVLFKKPNDLSSYQIEIADMMFTVEADYMYSVATPKYYASETQDYNKIFELILKFRSAIKAFAELTDEQLNINTIDNYVLDNFFLSYGFTLGTKIPNFLKANFALSLFKIYETKGTYTCFLEILQALNLDYGIFAIYLLRDIEGSDEFTFIKVPIVEDEKPEDYLNSLLSNTDDSARVKALQLLSISEAEVEALDPKWQTNLAEVKANCDGAFYIKTHYHWIEASKNLREISLLLGLANVVSRYISDDIKLSSKTVSDITLRQVIALFNSVLFKTMDVASDVEGFVSESALYGVASLWSPAELKERVKSIKTTIDLAEFFKEAKTTIRQKATYNDKRTFDDTLAIDVEAGKNELYKDLLDSVDSFTTLVQFTAQSEVRTFFDSFIAVLDDLFTQINLPTFGEQTIPTFEILGYFKSFYSEILSNRAEVKKWKEYLLNSDTHLINGKLDYSHHEQLDLEKLGFPLFYKEYESEFSDLAYYEEAEEKFVSFYFDDVTKGFFAYTKFIIDRFYSSAHGLIDHSKEYFEQSAGYVFPPTSAGGFDYYYNFLPKKYERLIIIRDLVPFLEDEVTPNEYNRFPFLDEEDLIGDQLDDSAFVGQHALKYFEL